MVNLPEIEKTTISSTWTVRKKMKWRGLKNENVTVQKSPNDSPEGSKMNKNEQTYIANCFRDSIQPDAEIQRFFAEQLNELSLISKRMRFNHWNVLFNQLSQYKLLHKIIIRASNIKQTCFKSLQNLLCQNAHIRKLNLSDVDLHGKGAMVLGNSYKNSDSVMNIERLAISNCQLDDSDLIHLKEYFANSKSLLKLNLSSNRFSGQYFAEILMKNRYLEKFDLSWNIIRRAGGCSLMKGLAANNSLLYFNISFCGLGNDGAMEIGVMLEVNVTLISLNLRDNRITNQGAQFIACGLTQNSTLSSLELSGNLITFVGMQHILVGAIKSGNLKELHMSQVSPDSLSLKAIKHLRESNTEIIITHGVPLNSKTTTQKVDKSVVIMEGISAEIRKYLIRERLRILDLFNMWDKDKSGFLYMSDLLKGLSECGIPVTQSMLQKFFKSLDFDNSGYVEYSEFIRFEQI